jgi:hypothetical protein
MKRVAARLTGKGTAAAATKSRKRAWTQGTPLWKTPLPPDVPGAWFDQAAVDKVLTTLRALRHTKGEWQGHPLEPDPWQV